MKSCSKNRKELAFLAMDILDAPRRQALEAHLKICEPCRTYFSELSKVSEKLRAVPVEKHLEPSLGFHQRVAAAIRSENSPSISEFLARLWSTLRTWRGFSSAAAAAAVLIVLVSLTSKSRRHRFVSAAPVLVSSATPPASPPRSVPAPTLANYQRIANESLDQLDALLARQGITAPAPTKVYTALNTGE